MPNVVSSGLEPEPKKKFVDIGAGVIIPPDIVVQCVACQDEFFASPKGGEGLECPKCGTSETG